MPSPMGRALCMGLRQALGFLLPSRWRQFPPPSAPAGVSPWSLALDASPPAAIGGHRRARRHPRNGTGSRGLSGEQHGAACPQGRPENRLRVPPSHRAGGVAPSAAWAGCNGSDSAPYRRQRKVPAPPLTPQLLPPVGM
ncbi:serine-rich coiled-coil domain-containing protein 2 [Platysternon megacephalum]|uniref:Serine-rich coiled-coil domain-containing protein 2 n=1 Tax=Platysternon megacephalum TaxID=55544 RepID=A0A4D9E9N1_9SAUR|nr:serine-rich coiled-coil domain-containing protein 2 [Platysternon megacephalum]